MCRDNSALKHNPAKRLLMIGVLIVLLRGASSSGPVQEWPTATPESQGIDSEAARRR
jgi:hypothetical protein